MDTSEITARVEAHVQASTGQKGSHTMQTRRVIAALRAIGLKRSEFSAQTKVNASGEYGIAMGHIKDRESMALVIEHAEVLVACGLRVSSTASTTMPTSALATTPRSPG